MDLNSDCEVITPEPDSTLDQNQSEMAEIRTRINSAGSSASSDALSSDGEDASLLPGVRHLTAGQQSAPVDRYKVVYLIFYLMGVGTLLPWNMFITAKDYFMYQLRNGTLPAENYKDTLTPLQLSYESAIAISNMLPNLLIQIINTRLSGRVSINKRIAGSMVVMIATFIITLIFTKLNVVSWQNGFYGITLTTVVFSSAASALLSSSLFGLAATFPQQYTQAVMGGMGLGGVFSAVAEIVTLSLGTSVTTSAFWYFMLAVIVLLFALASYFLLLRKDYAKYHLNQGQEILVEHTDVTVKSFFSEYLTIFKLIWPYSLSVITVFFVTLAMFPAITSAVTSVNSGTVWTDKYFLPLYCFLLFNCGDLGGRTLAGYVNMPKPKVTILACSAVRIIFIPLFMMCNAQPRGSLPVWFNSDVYPILFMAIFSLTNGYLSTQSLMIAPSLVSKEQTEFTGTLMSLSMTVGLSLGSAVSYAFVLLIKNA